MSKRNAVTIALFGSVWGLIEATMGGLLHFAHVPFTGTIMASIGFALLFAAMQGGLKPAELALVSLVAASFKFTDVLIFGASPFDIIITNPAVAIASQGLAFAAVFRRSPSPLRAMQLAPRFFVAAAASMVLFNAVSVVFFSWQTNHTQNLVNAAVVQLPLMALGATALALLAGRIRITASFGLQAAAAAGCAALAIAAHALL